MEKLPQWLKITAEGPLLLIHALPRASRTEICGEHDGRLKIKVQAPPVEGAANRSIQKFLSKKLRVPKKSVELVSGMKSRQKTFMLKGIPAKNVLAALSLQ